MTADQLKAPFPYFGGKATVAGLVWAALGRPKHYIEPFCGSCAVLLARPDYDPSTHIETVNDADGHIANVWRSIQFSPDEVARWADWPVNHADLMARKAEMVRNEDRLLTNLVADPRWHDPVLAGYYVWAASCWIGHGLTRATAIPHLAHGSKGVHTLGARPHLADAGMGVHKLGQVPHLANAGKGVHTLGKRPHLTHGGNGVHGIAKDSIYDWMAALSARLRRVRVVCGDWKRVCGGDWQDNMGNVGIFFDPPYGEKANRAPNLYSVDSLTVADDVRAWCVERGDRPTYRIVLAGYFEEHEELLNRGWSVKRWKTNGGYGNQGNGRGAENRHKEALFFSPHCIKNSLPLFANSEARHV